MRIKGKLSFEAKPESAAGIEATAVEIELHTDKFLTIANEMRGTAAKP